MSQSETLAASSDPVMTPAEAAAYIRRDEKTLKWWRYVGRGPSYLKMEGGQIRYRASDLEAYLQSQRIDPRAEE
jgi:hypothetical protein